MVISIFMFRGLIYKLGATSVGLNITILSFGVSLILLWMHENHHSGRAQNRSIYNWITNIGIYSYEIYLTHMFVIIFCVKAFKKLDFESGWLIPYILLTIFLAYMLGKEFSSTFRHRSIIG